MKRLFGLPLNQLAPPRAGGLSNLFAGRRMSFNDRCRFNAQSRRLVLISLCLLLTCAVPAAPAERAIFDLPQLDGIVIDGKAEDWGSRGFDAGLLARVDEPDDAPTDGSASLRLGWNDRGLLRS